MKIGWIFGGKEKYLTGVNVVIKETAKELFLIDEKNTYLGIDENYLNLSSVIPKNVIHWADEDFKNKSFNMLAKCNNIQILHSFFDSFHMVTHGCRKILTIHDLVPLVHPEWHWARDYFDGPIRQSANMADIIVAVSEYTKQEIIEYYDIKSEKIQVIYSGCNSNLIEVESDDSVISKYKLQEGYLLSVCTLEPRKNLRGLIEAFIAYKKRHVTSKVKLVLTGKLGWDPQFKKYLGELGNEAEGIVVTGFVNNAELAALYRHAIAMAYVSFYEGFGLPVLEAHSMGTAVIASDQTSIPEAGGDAAIYCNPFEKESIIFAIEQVINNEELRTQSVIKGIAHARKFSYKKAAAEILKIYQSMSV